MKEFIINLLEENKAEDILVINMMGKAHFADYMIIASGRSTKHVCSVAQNMMESLKKHGHASGKAFGMELGQWVLIDLGDIIVNVFLPEFRQLYNLEGLWSNKEAPLSDQSQL